MARAPASSMGRDVARDVRRRPGTRRRWLKALVVSAGWPAAVLASTGRGDRNAAVEVWVELSEPVPAGAANAAEARLRGERVAAQQRDIAQRLAALGVPETGRLAQVRNAIAVRATPAQVAAIAALPGVVRVRGTRSLHPPEVQVR